MPLPRPRFMVRTFAAVVVVAVGALAGASAHAQGWADDPYAEPLDAGPSVRFGIGFTADPETFLLAAGVPVELTRRHVLTPLIELGVDDDDALLSGSINYEYHFDLSGGSDDPDLWRLHPYLQAGAGFTYIHKDRDGGDDDEAGLLIRTGFGLEYELSDGFLMGSGMAFNVLPFEVSDENFFFSWQLLTMRFRF